MVATGSSSQNNIQKMKSPASTQVRANNVTPSPPAQRNDEDDECNESLLESAVKNIFGPCVGAVDLASYVLQSTCQGEDEQKKEKPAEVPVLDLKLKKPAPNLRQRRRQGETLEFPANAGFDDDVSAISARTLEEMERLEIFNKKRNGRLARGPPPKTQDLSWTYQVPRPVSNTSNNSLGVSTSGSASSAEPDQRVRTARGSKSTTRSSRLIDI